MHKKHQTKFLSPEVAVDTTMLPTGLQLLSPTLQQSIESVTSKRTLLSQRVDHFKWSTIDAVGNTPLCVNAEDQDENVENDLNLVEFDFDGFTLASLRGKKRKVEKNTARMDDHRNSCVSHVDSIDRDGKPYPTADCAVYYDDYSNFNPLSSSMSSVMTTNSTEDLAMSQRQRQYSFNSRIQRRSTEVVPSRNAFRTSSTAASAGFLMAKKKAMTAVVMRGWMQKRKGLVLKRWKKYYCLWKSDDSLCLYASEDTVNGRLEERYQVLRVVLTDKNNSFHIIGVDSGNAPRRVEFRVTISTEWIRWFQVLKKLLDKSSMEQALLSEPGVVFAKPYNKAEDDSCIDYNCESDALTNAKHIKSHDGRHSYSTQSKQLTTVSCAFYGAKRNEKLSTLFSGLSALSINARSQTCKELIPFQMKFGVETRDCQMIECSNEETVPILEIRGSESNTADYLQVLPPS